MIKNRLMFYRSVNRNVTNFIHEGLYEWLQNQLTDVAGIKLNETRNSIEVVYVGRVVTRITAVADKLEVKGKFSTYRTVTKGYERELAHEIARSIVIAEGELEG